MILDALAWVATDEDVAIARLASSILRDWPLSAPPLKTHVYSLVSNLGLPRGCGKRVKLATFEEVCRQLPIKSKRRDARFVKPRLTLMERLICATNTDVSAAWGECGYRRPSSSWAGGYEHIEVSIGSPYCSTRKTKAWSSNGKWSGLNVVRRITVPTGWRSKVLHHPDGAISDKGFLILWREGRTITVAEQSRGFEIAVRERRVG